MTKKYFSADLFLVNSYNRNYINPNSEKWINFSFYLCEPEKKKAAKNILSSLLHILQVFQGFSHLIFCGISNVHKVWDHTSFFSLHAAQPIAMVTSLLHQVLEIHFDLTLDFASSKLTVDKS